MPGEELLVKVAVEGFKEFEKAMQDFDKGMDGAADAAEESAAGTDDFGGAVGNLITGLKTAIVTLGALKIAQEAIQWAQEGAAIEAAAEKFEALSGGAQNAEQWMRDLRQATNYTISDFEMMAAVSKLMSMGLADNSEKAQQLVKMALMLGDQTRSAGDRINDFSLLLANQSVMRLDNFGISSGRVRQRIEELQKEFPGMTREVAFMNATLEEGQQAMNRLGGEANRATGSWQGLDAATRNITNSLKVMASDALTPAAEGLALLLSRQQRINDMVADFGQTAISAGMGWDEYNRGIMAAAEISGDLSRAKEVLRNQLLREGMSWADINRAMDDSAFVADKLIEYNIRVGDSFTKIEYEAIIAGNAAVEQGFRDVGAQAVSASTDIEEFGAASTENVMATKDAVDELSVAFQGRLGQAFDDFQEKAEGLRAKGEELRAKIVELEGRSWLTAAQREQLETTRTQLAENDAAIAANAAAHEEAVGRIIFSMAQQVAAQDGFTQQELDYLAAIGEQYGVLDEASATALSNIKRGMDDVSDGTRTAEEAARDLRNSILLLESKQITIGVNYDLPPIPLPGQPAGAPQAYANGGTTLGRSMLVGERGPELLTGVPGGARVLSAPTTARMMGGTSITNNYNLTTNSMTRPGGLALEFSAMEMGSR